MIKPKRPAIRYHGGKWKLAPWIISHFPPHKVYVEPFGGGGSVLLRKPRTYAEVYNDLDGEIVNLFRVLRDNPEPLIRAIELTPFARDEFMQAYDPVIYDHTEWARRVVVRSSMGFGSAAASGKATGFRSNSNRSGTTPAHDWANVPHNLLGIVQRLKGVVIENKDASEIMFQHDSPVTLHYVDPPYVHSTRAQGNPYCDKGQYRHEMDDEGHRRLATTLHELRGFVVLSGYPCELYDELYSGWDKRQIEAHADGARDRVECLWLNPACSAVLGGRLDFEEAPGP